MLKIFEHKKKEAFRSFENKKTRRWNSLWFPSRSKEETELTNVVITAAAGKFYRKAVSCRCLIQRNYFILGFFALWVFFSCTIFSRMELRKGRWLEWHRDTRASPGFSSDSTAGLYFVLLPFSHITPSNKHSSEQWMAPGLRNENHLSLNPELVDLGPD